MFIKQKMQQLYTTMQQMVQLNKISNVEKYFSLGLGYKFVYLRRRSNKPENNINKHKHLDREHFALLEHKLQLWDLKKIIC